MVLQNNVILQNDVPAKMYFTDHVVIPRTITDPATGRPGIRNVLEFDVDMLNDRPVSAKFSTMAEKLATEFAPFLPDKSYRRFDFVILQRGDGFQRSWTVLRTPH